MSDENYFSDVSIDSENEASGAILEEWGRQPMVREAALQQENEEDMHAEVSYSFLCGRMGLLHRLFYCMFDCLCCKM